MHRRIKEKIFKKDKIKMNRKHEKRNMDFYFDWDNNTDTNIYPMFSRSCSAQKKFNIYKDALQMTIITDPTNIIKINRLKKNIKRFEKLIIKYRNIIQKVKYEKKLTILEKQTISVTISSSKFRNYHKK